MHVNFKGMIDKAGTCGVQMDLVSKATRFEFQGEGLGKWHLQANPYLGKMAWGKFPSANP